MLQNGKNRRNKHKERNRNIYYKDVTSKESTVLLSLLPTVLLSAYTQSERYGKKNRCLAKSSFAALLLIGLVQHNSYEQLRK